MSRNTQSRKGMYRSREGAILGVCRGIAEYFDLSVFWVRAAAVVAFLLTGFWPIFGVYLIGALLMKPEPVQPFENEDECEFYDSYVYSPRGAAQRLKKKFQDLDRRIRRMEDTVTGREYDWDRRFNS